MSNDKITPIEVRKVSLEGTIESIEPLSEEWHQKYVGPRDDYPNCDKAHPEGRYFKAIARFENPFDSNYPVVQKDFPIPEREVEELKERRVTQEFYAHNNGLYRMVLGNAHLQGGGTEYLRGVTKNCDHITIDEFKILEE